MSRKLASLAFLLVTTLAIAELPRTTAETSNFQATTRHDAVIAFCDELAKQAPVVKSTTFGKSGEGRPMPLLILADSPAKAKDSKKPVVLLVGNIHAGEVDGKEASLAFAREIAAGSDRDLLKDLVILIVPNLNPDGNEKVGRGKRSEQTGPDELGERENAAGLDLNRDFVKLESPEIRALVKLVREWNPAVIVDMHTTDGSLHRHNLTYDCARHPNCGEKLLRLNKDFLTAAGERLKAATGISPFIYGNFSDDRTKWETYPPQPRYGVQYFGLRGAISVLSESYSHAPFAERVRASLGFARAICHEAAARKDELSKLAHEKLSHDRIAVRTKMVPDAEPRTIQSFAENGTTPQDIPVRVIARTEPTLEIPRPYAYLIPADQAKAIENLQRHGIELAEFREDIELDIEYYHTSHFEQSPRKFQGHQLARVEAEPRKQSKMMPAGTVLVRTEQPLGSLACLLLEPQSEDGLLAWNFSDSAITGGADYPILRLPAEAAILTGSVRPLADERVMNKPIDLDAIFKQSPPLSFAGNPTKIIDWTDDEHFLQSKEGKTYLVEARTGRCKLFFDPEKIDASLRLCPDFTGKDIEKFRNRQMFTMNSARTAALVEHNDNYFELRFDGKPARRFTSSGSGKEYPSFSPNGEWIAFTRNGNLYIADSFIGAERPLTVDGGGPILNGRADWVYEEEIFNRNGQAYWWSPDSKHIAFMRFDDSPVKEFTVVNHLPTRLDVEKIPYPKAGDPNPTVKLGIVPAIGGPPVFAELPYPAEDMLISGVGWFPDGKSAYVYVQNRTQTWLDVCQVPVNGGPVRKLFRETTKAWVDDPEPLTFLPDGSFLWLSDRTGWRHIYRYSSDGALLNEITKGEWEIHKLVGKDKDWVYFTTTWPTISAEQDLSLSRRLATMFEGKLNLFRTHVDGTGRQHCGQSLGWHSANLSPDGKYFADTWSSLQEPTTVLLYESSRNLIRRLDINPVYSREEYRFGKIDSVQVECPDGITLSGLITFPPNFEPAKKYPVWVKTYAGPHTPTVQDIWAGGRVQDQVLASLGIVVFQVDPRSASGKSRESAWTAYKHLGVGELKDLEAAVNWISKNPWVDPKRIGLQGHSYGGYITAYALTHSKKFCAGIAGAPVTDWRNYDSIYTERYMGLPQDNPAGYDAGSVVKAAKNLHGKLLIIHGLIDDNVHFQNSVQLIHELEKADKDFEVMVYPLSRHGIHGRHYQRQIINFITRSLGIDAQVPPESKE
ncbi:MAG: DPP IV N-terminal domain-containing protein [Gemmataceae bacterium]